MNNQNQIQPGLEEKINCALKIIYHLFPKKKEGTDKPYELKKETRGSSDLANFNFIRLGYDKSGFEKPLEIKDFSEALIGYYQLVTGENPKIITEIVDKNRVRIIAPVENILMPGKKTEIIRERVFGQNRVRIEIPKENTRIIGYLDTDNQYMYFAYKMTDTEAQKMIDAYTNHLMNE
ncbi:hypothetical protein AYK26_04560 [Euryarchaeota archaeon SM23-78]|nr:MAG: hypothetical protein AYK26_04560 [Euryarchaeota archaeon SM23-78]MBW3000710.1 hypothetical protein [Candidatus Woesearchaeota archaeon]